MHGFCLATYVWFHSNYGVFCPSQCSNPACEQVKVCKHLQKSKDHEALGKDIKIAVNHSVVAKPKEPVAVNRKKLVVSRKESVPNRKEPVSNRKELVAKRKEPVSNHKEQVVSPKEQPVVNFKELEANRKELDQHKQKVHKMQEELKLSSKLAQDSDAALQQAVKDQDQANQQVEAGAARLGELQKQLRNREDAVDEAEKSMTREQDVYHQINYTADMDEMEYKRMTDAVKAKEDEIAKMSSQMQKETDQLSQLQEDRQLLTSVAQAEAEELGTAMAGAKQKRKLMKKMVTQVQRAKGKLDYALHLPQNMRMKWPMVASFQSHVRTSMQLLSKSSTDFKTVLGTERRLEQGFNHTRERILQMKDHESQLKHDVLPKKQVFTAKTDSLKSLQKKASDFELAALSKERKEREEMAEEVTQKAKELAKAHEDVETAREAVAEQQVKQEQAAAAATGAEMRYGKAVESLKVSKEALRVKKEEANGAVEHGKTLAIDLQVTEIGLEARLAAHEAAAKDLTDKAPETVKQHAGGLMGLLVDGY